MKKNEFMQQLQELDTLFYEKRISASHKYMIQMFLIVEKYKKENPTLASYETLRDYAIKEKARL